MKSDPWRVLRSGPCEPAFNMAMDEALLKAMPRLAIPTLRFYGWTERAASFGYFQKYADIERLTPLRPLIRRPTGGGLVPHDADWTYSVTFPPIHPWYSLVAIESYRNIHEWLQAAFEKFGIPTEVAAEGHKTLPGQCFQGHEKFDLLWHGKKIAGAAQRRTRDGLLIQGSIQPASLSANQTAWQEAMCEAAQTQTGVTWEKFVSDATLIGHAEDLVRQKYSQAHYNRKR